MAFLSFNEESEVAMEAENNRKPLRIVDGVEI